MMDALEKYVDSLSTPESELLRALDHETHMQTIQPRMLSGHIQGKLLEMFVRMLRPRSILEIGTFTGYSALSMAAGLGEGATLDTIEVDDELEELAQRFFDRSPCGGKIRLHIDSADSVHGYDIKFPHRLVVLRRVSCCHDDPSLRNFMITKGLTLQKLQHGRSQRL